MQLGTVADTRETPRSAILSSNVRVGKSVINALDKVLSVDALVALDIGDFGRGTNGFKSVGSELAGWTVSTVHTIEVYSAHHRNEFNPLSNLMPDAPCFTTNERCGTKQSICHPTAFPSFQTQHQQGGTITHRNQSTKRQIAEECRRARHLHRPSARPRPRRHRGAGRVSIDRLESGRGKTRARSFMSTVISQHIRSPMICLNHANPRHPSPGTQLSPTNLARYQLTSRPCDSSTEPK